MNHLGTNGNAMCGASHLLGGMTVTDMVYVDCLPCLWKVLATLLQNTDVVAARIKQCTEEASALLAPVRQ